MPQIRLLDPSTVNKIAAGEVVERPASVVKEMVENAIDAGADRITVEIKDGGESLIRITDNGCGIDQDQIRTAFLRHSTSKIRKVEDLMETVSLGFRGEALASIASVARVEMITKTREEKTGTRFVIEGGVEKVMEEAACHDGTTIKVENLFFNTPARKKFLKKPASEAAAVTDLMQKMILAHPEVAFTYYNGKSEPSLQSQGKGKLKNSIFTVYGKDVVDKVLPVEGEVALSESSSMKVAGYISRPQLTKTNRSLESFFINGRYVRSSLLEKAIDEAYKDLIAPGTFPAVILHLSIDPHSLDVNVHPTKMEIRFMQEAETRRGLYEILIEALRGNDLIARAGEFHPGTVFADAPVQAPIHKEIEIRTPSSAPKANEDEKGPDYYLSGKKPSKTLADVLKKELPRREPRGAVSTTEYDYAWKPQKDESAPFIEMAKEEPAVLPAWKNEKPVIENMPEASVVQKLKPMTEEKPVMEEEKTIQPEIRPYSGEQIAGLVDEVEKKEEEKKPRELKLIGQVFKTYWIAEENDIMYLMDQHAAHERVLYDRYRALLQNGQMDTQLLMEPSVCMVDPKVAAGLEDYLPLLERMGYRVEAFGEDAVIVRGVPFLFGKSLPVEDMVNLLDLAYEGSVDSARDLLIDRIATMSCKAAVKGNDAMSFEEAQELLKQLFASNNPYNCPHGRPTIISVTQYQLEKRFKRV